MTKITFSNVFAALFGLSTILYACGGNETKDGASATKPAPDRGKELVIRREVAPSSLNPLLPMNGYARFISAQLFQTLGIDDPETTELQPLMVKAIPVIRKVADGKYKGCYAYDFEMHELATWDNGSPITGNDVVFTLKIIMHPELQTQTWRSYFADLKDVEVDAANPRKFTVYFKQYYFLALESLCQTPIYPIYNYDPKGYLSNTALSDMVDPKKAAALVAKDKNLYNFAIDFLDSKFSTDKTGVCGSTAYKLDFFEPDQAVTLVRKTNWWGDKVVAANKYLASYPEKITYKTVKDEDAAINLLRSGDLDLAMSIAPAKFLDLQKDAKMAAMYDFKTNWSASYNRLLFNTRDPLLSDIKVRQALSQAVDYDFLVKTIQQNMAERILGPISPVKPYFAKDIPMYNYDIDKAKALLTAAGWADADGNGILEKNIKGKTTELMFKVLVLTGNAVSEQVAANLQSTFQKVGVKMEAEPVDLNTMTQNTISGKFQMALNSSALQPGLVELFQNFHSTQLAPKGDNRSGIVNPALDKLITQIRSTEDPAARTPLYIQAQQILHDQAPEIYLYAPRSRYIVSKRLEYNVSSVPPGYFEQYFKIK